ncbi:MAG: winged helix DNA-binding protein [Defluviitaleaceae bacterium]|nr:winged helix DNA-binding protein [Defluviitaleaceae bacterium]
MRRTDAEEYCVGSVLNLANKLQVWGDEVTGEVTLKQLFLLLSIAKMPANKRTLQAIADNAGSSRQNIKKMLSQLKEKDYVQVESSFTDARSLQVALTPKAYRYFEATTENSMEAVGKLFAQISDNDLNATIQALEKLQIALGRNA